MKNFWVEHGKPTIINCIFPWIEKNIVKSAVFVLTRMVANIDRGCINDISFAYGTGDCTINILQIFALSFDLFGHNTFWNSKFRHVYCLIWFMIVEKSVRRRRKIDNILDTHCILCVYVCMCWLRCQGQSTVAVSTVSEVRGIDKKCMNIPPHSCRMDLVWLIRTNIYIFKLIVDLLDRIIWMIRVH